MFSSIALKKFAGISERLDLVNISSLAAIQPFESWGVYCIGKAARDMLIQIVAKEVESVASLSRGTSIKALNYAPGPVDTDMQAEIRSTASVPEQKALYTSLFNEGKLVTADGTTAKLVGILEKNDYKCGAHVDYFDE
jgi:sepiapterin reductase